jgi:predicted Zn-dependent peptidase
MTLPNGLRLVAVEMPHLHSAEIAIYLKAGGRNDPMERAGLSHFLEHMLFRGTADYPGSLELESAFEAIGGSVNASTDEECTCYFSRVHPDHVATGLQLFASMILTPTLPGIEIEKRIITEEALEDINEHGEQINPHNLTSQLLWPGHQLGLPTVGTLESIAAISASDLKQHMADYYTPPNTIITVAGAVEAEQTFAACNAAFGKWKGAPPPPLNIYSGGQGRPQSAFVMDSDSQVHLQLNFRGFSRSDGRLMATRLLRRILCGGGSARLHITLRERLGIVYSVDANIAAYEETGAFAIELSTAPENLLLAVTEVLKETGRLASIPIPEAELLQVKNAYFFDLDYSMDSTYEMQVRYGWGELMGLDRHIEEDRREAEALDTGAIMATARGLFAPHQLNLVAVGPLSPKMEKEVEKAVQAYVKQWDDFVL